jgi:capsule biosynthesis phosphatase
MKRLIIDLDDTLTLATPDGVPTPDGMSTPGAAMPGAAAPEQAPSRYAHALPNLALIARLREYRAKGFDIVISTSRSMRTFDGNIGKINAHTLPVILDWLGRHDVPYDEIYVGKPWCGLEGFYVDDRSIRPSEFLRYSLPAIHALLAAEKAGA